MKKVMLTLTVIASIVFTACKNDSKNNSNTSEKKEEVTKIAGTDATFGVRGNCSMCKSTIEKAANSVEGVISANWSIEQKKLDITYDNSKTNEMAIHKAVANSGYDTEKIMGNETAYNELPGCCHYDHEMQMNMPMKNGAENHQHEE